MSVQRPPGVRPAARATQSTREADEQQQETAQAVHDTNRKTVFQEIESANCTLRKWPLTQALAIAEAINVMGLRGEVGKELVLRVTHGRGSTLSRSKSHH